MADRVKIVVTVPSDEADARKIFNTIKAAHSYEEPVIDVYPLLNYNEL